MTKRSVEATSRIMSHIRGKDTKIELMLRKELWSHGFRYQKNVRGIPGTPDIVFKKQKIAIFCDSEFWHGFEWEARKNKFAGNNKEYWLTKIQRNIDYDLIINGKLKENGWIVLRFWGAEIKYGLRKVTSQIIETVIDRNGNIDEH